jgi:hypothetical protein
MNCTNAVALTAARESAKQLERGDEVNRQAEVANPRKCKDLLQSCYFWTPGSFRLLKYLWPEHLHTSSPAIILDNQIT